jgi:hypothetical protein
VTEPPERAPVAGSGCFETPPARYASGWYPDPTGRFDLRFHNGRDWTADVARDGERFVDPAGIGPGPAAPSAAERRSGVATAAMVLGIVGLSLAWLPILGVLGAVSALAAVALGVLALRRARPDGPTPDAGRSRAVVGITTGVGGLLGAAVGVYLTIVVLDVYSDYLEPEPAETRVVACELAGSRATATVEIRNVGDEAEDYSVVVAFVRPGTDNAHRTDRVEIDDVAPGATAVFEAQRQVELDEVDCLVTEVTGPLPFGISLD